MGRGKPRALAQRLAVLLAAVLGAFDVGCASHSETMLPVRTALDQGNFKGAIAELNKQMDVKSDKELPKDMGSDNSLKLLDRASLQQVLVQFSESEHDYQEADKAIDLLDLSHNAADTIAKYMFSDSANRYRAPAYEKLLVNTLNMVNYLETGDLNGARIEARRLGVYLTYYRDKAHEDSAVLGLAGLLAGFAFEKSGDANAALHYYDDALQFGSYPALVASVKSAMPLASYTTPRLTKALGSGPAAQPIEETGEGEVLVVAGYGRVPHKIANRVPIGLALTYASLWMSPANIEAANRMAAQGLVTWVNFPSLAPAQTSYELPSFLLDGRPASLEQAVNVTQQVMTEWKKIEGQIIAAAVIRMITRAAVGGGIQAATSGGNDTAKAIGILASMVTQGTMVALDKPDTRSWETLPARISVARVRVPAGRHTITLSARGVTRQQDVDVAKGGFSVVSLMALR